MTYTNAKSVIDRTFVEVQDWTLTDEVCEKSTVSDGHRKQAS